MRSNSSRPSSGRTLLLPPWRRWRSFAPPAGAWALESAADWERRLHDAQIQSAALACPDPKLREVLLRLAPTWKGTAAEMWETGRAIVGAPHG